jgi:Flp pilus assembly protein TadD
MSSPSIDAIDAPLRLPAKGRLPPLFLYLGLLALTLAAFAPLWRNDFIEFDDPVYITDNPDVLSGFSREGFRWAWTTLHAGYWHPLTWLSLQCDAQFFARHGPGAEHVLAQAFHLDNLLWHCGTVLLLFAALRSATGMTAISWVTAALFAVHPLRVESVAWAAERKDVLSMFFGALTLLLYVHYARAPQWTRYLGVVAAFTLGLLAKPSLVTLPCALLLLDYWPLRRFGAKSSAASEEGCAEPASFARASMPRLLVEKLPLLVLAIAASILAVFTQGGSGALRSLEEVSMADRLATAAVGYVWYLEKTVWPQGLGLFYPRPPWSPLGLAISLAIGIAITAAAWVQAVRWPWLLVGWLWFLGTLFPVSGVAQAGMQAWADRFTYLPHVGLLLALVMSLDYLRRRLQVPGPAAGVVAGLGVALLSTCTWIQVGYWRGNFTIWEHTLKVTSQNARAYSALAYDYWHHRHLAKALEYATEAFRIQPDYLGHRYIYAAASVEMGRADEAARRLQESLERNPNLAAYLELLGVAEAHQGHWQQAATTYRRLLELEPEWAQIWAKLGTALWRLCERDEAVRSFERALELDPNQPEALNGLGVAAMRAGDYGRATATFNRALASDPRFAEAHSNLGVALGRQGAWNHALDHQRTAVHWQASIEQFLRNEGANIDQEDVIPDVVTYRCRLGFALFSSELKVNAFQQYQEALRRAPDWPKQFMATAWKLATHRSAQVRDPASACELAAQVCQAADKPSAEMLDVLAAAYAAAGRFSEAVSTAQQALQSASAAKAGAQAIEGRLQLYKQGKPFIDAAEPRIKTAH